MSCRLLISFSGHVELFPFAGHHDSANDSYIPIILNGDINSTYLPNSMVDSAPHALIAFSEGDI